MKQILPLAIVSLYFCGSAAAQIPGLKLDVAEIEEKARAVSDREFEAMDANRDGKVSRSEYMDYVMEENRRKYEAAFNNIDQNNDGMVSKQEYEDFMNFATGKIHDFMNILQKRK